VAGTLTDGGPKRAARQGRPPAPSGGGPRNRCCSSAKSIRPNPRRASGRARICFGSS